MPLKIQDYRPDPAFSGVESSAELLLRVQRRLASVGAVGAAERSDPVVDLARSDGLGSGWYDAETLDGLAMRWTQRRFDFEADVADATHVQVEACLFPESGLRSLTARMSADEIPGIPFLIRPGWNSLLLPIPGGRHGRVVFAVDAGGSWRPADRTGSGDDRELSLLVRRLALVRFVELPRFASDPAPSLSPRAGFPGRVLGKLRRLFSLDARLSLQERRLDEAMALLEARLTALAEADAQVEADLARREEGLREDVARTLKELRRD